jgi:catechol-2,3-dioxygenase
VARRRRRPPARPLRGHGLRRPVRAREGVAPRPTQPADPNEHFALALDRANFEQARRDLDRLGIAYEVWDHGICDSLYVSDPEGHLIELTTYRR